MTRSWDPFAEDECHRPGPNRAPAAPAQTESGEPTEIRCRKVQQTMRELEQVRQRRVELSGAGATKTHPDPEVQAIRDEIEALGEPAPWPPMSVPRATRLAQVKACLNLAKRTRRTS